MAIQKILTLPHPLLRQKSKPVRKIDQRIKRIINDLKETLLAQKNPKGVGLSAPQIGEFLRICLVYSKASKKWLTFLNPEIIWQSKRLLGKNPKDKIPLEGCLSVPGFWGIVRRQQKVKIRYLTPRSQTVIRKFSGLTSTVIQHEIDHLEGILFIDRVLAQKEKLYKVKKDESGKEILQEVEIT